jgi:hypothetical protein
MPADVPLVVIRSDSTLTLEGQDLALLLRSPLLLVGCKYFASVNCS